MTESNTGKTESKPAEPLGQPTKKLPKPPKPRKVEKRRRGRKG